MIRTLDHNKRAVNKIRLPSISREGSINQSVTKRFATSIDERDELGCDDETPSRAQSARKKLNKDKNSKLFE